MVIFDRIAGSDHADALEARYRGQESQLNLFRQRRRDAVGVNRGVVETFRLQEDLVPVAIAEPDDLVLDRRAIAWSGALDLPRIHRRAVHIGANDLVGRRRRAGDAALDPVSYTHLTL